MSDEQPAPEIETATVVPPPAPPEPTVEIAKGVSVPLSQFRAAADPNCGFCSAGIQAYIEGGQTKYRPCGCAIRHIHRALRGKIPTAPFARVEKDPERERERLEKRLAPMRAEADRMEAEIAERTRGNDEGIAEAESAVRVSEKLCAASVAHVAEQEAELQRIRAKAAEEIAAQESLLAGERELLSAREKGKTNAIDALQTILAKQHVVLENVKGSRKRAENLRRRIALIEARHAAVLKVEESC